MNYYFFPHINGFDSSVTLVNYPPLDNFPLFKKANIYITWSNGNLWNYKLIEKLIHIKQLK